MEAKMSTELEKRNIRRMSNKESNRITKECICDALIGLMKEHPYKDINMTMIIKKSGASRASVYRNYPSKEAIIQDITKNITDELSASLTGVLHKSNTYEWFLKVFSRLHSVIQISLLRICSIMPCVLPQTANTLPNMNTLPEVLLPAYGKCR